MNKTKILPIVTIVGRPNVGKSTLFNRIVGRRVSLEFPEAGTTRDRLYAESEWQGKKFLLADTAGLAFSKKDLPLFEEIGEQIKVAITSADLVLFVVDGKEGLVLEDEEAAKVVRKSGKNVILAVNKSERATKDKLAEFYKLGLGEPMALAAISGVGVGDLLDAAVSKISKIEIQEMREEKPGMPTLIILGRPNVGKSSIFNALAREKRAIVSDIPGTTRDILDTEIEFGGKNYCFLDTAGLRRRGKIQKGIEAVSVLRALRALAEADIALLVLAADEEIANQDLHIAGFTKEEGKGLVIIVNKFDLTPRQMDQKLSELHQRFVFAPYAPVIFVSAKTNQNIEYIFEVVDQIWNSRNKKIEQGKVDQFIQQINISKKMPLRIKTCEQTGTNPPEFSFRVSNPKTFHFSDVRFLDRQLHEQFEFMGTPIKIILESKKRL